MFKTNKEKIKKRLSKILVFIYAGLICIAAMPAFPVQAASGNDNAIASYIYAHTATASADTDWVKYIKNTFASETGITNASSGDAIKWAEVPASGVSAPWNGTALGVASTLPDSHTDGAAELVAQTSTDADGIQTVIYTQYAPATITGDPDISTLHLEVVTDTSVAGALPEYHVYTGEALLYAMNMFSGRNGGSLYLEQDIDLNGQYHYWPGANMLDKQQFHGKGHKIYNLCVVFDELTLPQTGHRTGFVYYLGDDGVFENVTFESANIIGCSVGTSDANYAGYGTGVITYAEGSTTINNVHVNNSLIVGSYQAAPIVGRIQTSVSMGGSARISHCSTSNCTVFGKRHEGSLTGNLLGDSANNVFVNADHCYTVGGVVFSTDSHSGGLFSCMTAANISDCFTDVHIYGTDMTGVFTGAIDRANTINNCFASGFIEGHKQIGGFAGYIAAGSNLQMSNCYTTAMTGISTGGTYMGGFVGLIHNVNSAVFTNCYAAGEVGSVDTNVAPPAGGNYNAATQPQQCGGFVGAFTNGSAGKTQFTECYYDKQMTAMREWAVGLKAAGENYDNIIGVLTTDTSKSGNGLTSENFSEATGFARFTTGEWNYTARHHYPELDAFRSAAKADWLTDEAAALVRAYSLSSTSTLMLDTWEYGLDTSTGEFTVPLPAATYCTVRDLTSGFNLTSSEIQNWDRVGTQNNKGTGGAKSTIEGEEYDVLSLKKQNGTWLCDELVPGMEWLRVTCEDSSQTATRRMRVIPTAGLDAGKSAVITDKYDHADDVELYFSTGARMAVNTADITTGIYPDKDGAANALTTRQWQLMDGVNMSGANDAFRSADVSYMSDGTDNAKNGNAYVYVYPVTGFNSASNQIQLGPMISFSSNDYAAKFNGYTDFENVDERFLISYMWTLNDGRVIQDAKMVRRAMIPFNVDLNLYTDSVSDANRYATGGYLYTGVNAPGAISPVLTDFSGFGAASRIKAQSKSTAEFKEHAQTAWKLVDPAVDTLKSITVNISFSDTENFSKTISGADITPGKVIQVPCIEKRIVYKDGIYFTIPETVMREYTLQHDATNDVWYLNFEKSDSLQTSSEGYVFKLNDVETNITVDLVTSSKRAQYTIIGKKTLTGDKTTFAADEFSFKLTEDADNNKSGYTGFTGNASLSANGTVTFDTLTFSREGTYVFTAKETGKAPNGYIYDKNPVTVTINVTADANGYLSAKAQFSKQGGGTELLFANRYVGNEYAGNKPFTGDDSSLWIYAALTAALLTGAIAITITLQTRKINK